jgi:toxin HigB-1
MRLGAAVAIPGPEGTSPVAGLDLVDRCRQYLDTVYHAWVHWLVAIQGFADAAVERFFARGQVDRKAGWAALAKVVARKLDMLDYAAVLADLRAPPSNRLEALKGDLQRYHSIRVNDQWRVVFRWTATGPADVDVVDYH